MSRDDTAGEKSDPVDKLTPRQVRLVMELMGGHTLTKAAERAGVSLPTAKRYLKQPVVKEALQAQQRQSLSDLSRMLASFDQLAVGTLVELARDKVAPPATRRAAANALLQRRLQAFVVADLEQRVERLEDATDDDDPYRWNG